MDKHLRVVEGEQEPKHIHEQLVRFFLELAKSAADGDIRSAAVALEHPDGGTSDRWIIGIGSYPVRILGAIEMMKFRFCQGIRTEVEE